MFTPTTSFNKVGKLVFRLLNSGEFPDKSFDHWAMATPDNNPGDIIAYGNTLIPEEVDEMEMVKGMMLDPGFEYHFDNMRTLL